MGFGYAGTFLIIFLTHPGVIIPVTSSEASFPPVLRGVWQTMWVWILGIAGEKSAGLAWTMYNVYLVFLFLYMYLFIGVRIEKGV